MTMSKSNISDFVKENDMKLFKHKLAKKRAHIIKRHPVINDSARLSELLSRKISKYGGDWIDF